MFELFKKMFESKPFSGRAAIRPETVSFDDAQVVRTLSDGRTESIRWRDLREVQIVTTDQGPFVDDVFWLLIGEDGGCLVPSQAEGMSALLERLGELPDFDHRAVIEAMGSTDNNRFEPALGNCNQGHYQEAGRRRKSCKTPE